MSADVTAPVVDDDEVGFADDVDDDVDEEPLHRQAAARQLSVPRSQRPTYKPGHRQVDEDKGKNSGIGAPPWWSRPRGDQVWEDKQVAFKAKGGLETKNVVGWQSTGLTGGRGW